jgi:hypothetical protein
MKRRLCFLTLLSLACTIATELPARAQDIYDNGQILGSQGSWSISSGSITSDSFGIVDGSNTVTGLQFGAWLTPGDVLQSVEISITNEPLGGGLVHFDQQVNIQQGSCFLNSMGFDVCLETASFNGPVLGNQEYWLNLTNARTSDGQPVYWDENSGIGCQVGPCPSDAEHTGVGTIPSEAFTIFGTHLEGGTAPEPGSLVLFSSGLLAAVGVARRKLR